jgi:hypothetical protein
LPKKLNVVYLEWYDSCSSTGWEEKGDDSYSKIRTVGILVSENKKCLTVSTSKSIHKHFMDKLTIPKVCITKRKKVRFNP